MEAIGAVATPRQFESVNRNVREVVETVKKLGSKIERVELSLANLHANRFNQRPMDKEELEKRADIAVRTLLPKHSLKSIINFFADDCFRQDALVRYLKQTLPHDDSTVFMFKAFKAIIHDDCLRFLSWPQHL